MSGSDLLRSMTGYGSAAGELPGGRVDVTARSVNHRYLDLSVAVPRRLAALEGPLKQLFQKGLGRGRVEVFVRTTLEPGIGVRVAASPGLARGVVEALRGLRDALGLEDEVALSDLMRFPGVLEVQEDEAALDPQAAAAVLAAAEGALGELQRMREAEGGRLAEALTARLDAAAGAADRIEALLASEAEARREALLARARELAGELGLEEARLYQEVVRLVDRAEIREELDRLRSHLTEARDRIAKGGQCGKSLDFLTQELMREGNTMGSKSASARLTREVVFLKGEIEKFREQVQNVE
jgi:uncharacterized protein (TIGR00255 family)